MNFHTLLEIDNAEDKVLKIKELERVEEEASSSLEVAAQHVVQNCSIETTLVEVMNHVIKEHTKNGIKVKLCT